MEKEKEYYLDIYKRSKRTSRDLVNMEINEAVGFYLFTYPVDTKRVVLQDMQEGLISCTIGNAVVGILDII